MTTPEPSAAASDLPAPDLSRTALFLDFDGTLAPIVDRPDLAALPEGVHALLARLGERTGGALAVLSGRPLVEIDRLLAPLVLPVAGSHGLERRGPQGHLSVDARGAQALQAAAAQLAAFAERAGILFERKPCGVALHFRLHPECEGQSRRLADEVAGATPELRVIHGHMVAEVTLSGRDKGRALEDFMTEPPFQGRTPLAAGDDVTDEDAFAAAERLGGGGLKIGPGPSSARWRARDIGAFHAWLSGLAGSLREEDGRI